MLAYVVMVWTERFSHVEGVVVRQRRVWMTARPLAPSPAATVVLSVRYNGESLLRDMLAPPVEWERAWTV